MKTLKSNGGSFGISIINPNGLPYRAGTDGFTDANNIDVFSVYRVSNVESEDTYIAHLPSGSGQISGTLITFPYSTTRGSQIFIRYNTSQTTGVYVRHKFTDGQWLDWKLIDGSVVTA